MPTRVAIHHRVIPTVSIQIHTREIVGFEVVYAVGGDESAGFGVVITRLQIVEPGFTVEIVTSVTNGVDIADEAFLLHYTTRPALCQI